MHPIIATTMAASQLLVAKVNLLAMHILAAPNTPSGDSLFSADFSSLKGLMGTVTKLFHVVSAGVFLIAALGALASLGMLVLGKLGFIQLGNKARGLLMTSLFVLVLLAGLLAAIFDAAAKFV